MKIIGIDPGTHTGICVYDARDGVENPFTFQTLGPRAHHEALWDVLGDDPHELHVVCERFTYQRRDKVILDSVEYIGVVKLWCAMYGTKYNTQTPSAAMNLWTDGKIKRLGLWRPNKAHEMDALRHVLYYLTNTLKDYAFIRQARQE